MTEAVERTVIDAYAKELAELWRANNTLHGARAFLENEDKRKALLERAAELGIRDDVYARAGDLFHGR